MPTFGSFLVATLAASLGVASAVPPRVGTPMVPSGGSFEIKQVRNEKFVSHAGPLALAKAYNKYGHPVPDDVAQAVNNIKAALGLERRESGSVTATPEAYDQEYLCPVQIGTPAQTLNLDFDSGSSDLWVFSSETPPNESKGHLTYNPSSSSTSHYLSGESWSITYGDGSSSSGNVYTDKVTIGPLTVSNQAVECAQQVSSQFVSDTANDGLVGLAFSSINTVRPDQQKTWFDNIKPNLNAPLFSANLKHNQPGSYLFGSIDTSAYTGALAYTPVSTANGFWEWQCPGFEVGSSGFQYYSIDSIADTGTSLLLLPDAVVQYYYSQTYTGYYNNAQGGYTFDCSESLPDFSFAVGNSLITIPGSYMNYAPVSSTTCYGGLQSSAGIGFSIFGDVALKASYVVFDSGNLRLGWANKPL